MNRNSKEKKREREKNREINMNIFVQNYSDKNKKDELKHFSL